MGLFKKDKKEAIRKELPSLPDLPKLPDFPGLENEDMQISKLPNFPYNSLGSKFSQNAIKEAVTLEEEGDGLSNADEFASEDSDEMRMMQEPLRTPFAEERENRFSQTKFSKKRNFEEPIFIRIDRFEDALKIFNDTKDKLSEMETALEEIKRIREKEEGELHSWREEIKIMKEHIEKVDRDIFSKI